MRILYDGWPLAYAPLSAGAWHLRTLLALGEGGYEAILALPTEPQAMQAGLQTVFRHTHDHGEWEQRLLPELAAELGAAIHTTGLASLFAKVPTLVSPAEHKGEVPRTRLAEAQGFGGLARATVLWPKDLPRPRLPGRVQSLEPMAHPEFKPAHHPATVQGMPDEFLLVHGLPDERAVLQLLESWTWAAASIGEFYPLVIVGLNEHMQAFVRQQLPKFTVEGSVRLAADLAPQDLPSIYAVASAIVHVGEPAAWGNSLRLALASGKAIVAHQDALTESILGEAGYLIKADDRRGFGAAMITCVVDEKAREKLEDAAQARTAHWKASDFQSELKKVYSQVG